MGEFPLLYAVLQYMILHSDSIQILLYQIKTDFVTWVSIAVIRLLKVETILSLSLHSYHFIYTYTIIYIYICTHCIIYTHVLYQIIRLIWVINQSSLFPPSVHFCAQLLEYFDEPSTVTLILECLGVRTWQKSAGNHWKTLGKTIQKPVTVLEDDQIMMDKHEKCGCRWM